MNSQEPISPPPIPALIYWDEPTGNLKVAALHLLDRLLVAVHRAGAGPITIVANHQPPEIRRARALNIGLQIVTEPPARTRTTLVAASNLLVQTADVRRLLQTGGRLATSTGTPLPIGLLPPGAQPWMAAMPMLPQLEAEGVACLVSDAATARVAERALWKSLTSSTDGLVDRVFNRPCGRLLSKLLIYTPISPNAVSVASILIGVLAAAFFAVGQSGAALLGAILFQLSAIVDCVDGDLARVLFKESPLGKWLDLAGDQVVHVAVFAGIAVGLLRSGESPVALWLGLSAVVGALLSFAVVLRGMRQPSGDRSFRLQKWVDAATNRDFSVLILVLVCVDLLEWFLWLSAIGSHVFWITALALQSRTRAQPDLR